MNGTGPTQALVFADPKGFIRYWNADSERVSESLPPLQELY
ncbi:hypothetical protein [Tsukamurella pseudospumae]|nr:hypothetical protein [Tsukamurella pseudospumae]